MLFPFYYLATLATALIPSVAAVASTDSYTDADPGQSGYLPNHNMDPAVVDSAEFGQLWKVPFNAKEQFYAKPLVYTPSGAKQLLFLASSQNWIRTLDAKTGAPINARQVHTPFLQSDIGCTDIPNTIGIIGTPVIDPSTDIAYFFSKTYIPNYRTAGNTGTYNGVYYFHGVNVNTLADVGGFPILVDGSQSDNAPAKYFVGGVILQRPALTQVGSVVYGAFGGHCDLFNYTGLVIGIDINQKKIITNFATESGPLAPQTNVWNQNGGGGQGGIWMSGMALASDGNRIFFVSGNGGAHENQGVPASGSSGCKTLGEACVDLGINADGTLSLTDYFQPYDYQNMDGGDEDFGSGGIALLDSTVFRGTGVSKMGVTAGKNGKIYVLNINNMGGFKLGPGQTDNVIQTIVTNQAVFGAAGSYPLEGGYIYFTPVGYPTYVYKLGFSQSGVPVFSQVGQSAQSSAGRVGVGVPTITSFQGREGTGILWMCDPDVGLRAWYAVPQANGVLKSINLPQVTGANKFQRPAFGDARLYVTDANGALYCLGSPVNLPLNCTSPVDFGPVALGSSATQTVTCLANIPITSINGATVGDAHFHVNNASLPTGPLAAGATFSFPVAWDLTNTVVQDAANASYGNTAPGIKSTPLTLLTTNGIAGYSSQFPISLTGQEVSKAAYLSLTPVTVDYSGIVLLNNQATPSVTLPFVIANSGLSPLTITGYAYTQDDLGDGDAVYTNVTFYPNGTMDLGYGYFTSNDLPVVGTVLQAGSQVSVQSTFLPTTGVGSYQAYFTIWSTGGSKFTILEGSASTAPIANFSISNGEGGWLPQDNLLMDFGDVAPGSTSSRQIRICDVGGSVLEISKSKPPNGVFHLDDPGELGESQQIPIGQCAYGTVLFVTNTEDPNIPNQTYNNTWTLNTNDLSFGVHTVQIIGTVVDKQVGPVNATGNSVYSYLGCYSDTNPAGRLLPHEPYEGNNNTNGNCQAYCLAGGYIFSGTEYQIQCFCGNNPPSATYLDSTDTHCTFACSGDGTEDCGGVNGYISIYYDATKYTPGSDSTTGGTTTNTGGPITVNSTGNYNYIGCYTEATTGRALSGLSPPAPANGFTIESCQAACKGYTLFGMEYSNECYCGNTLGAGSVAQASSSPTTNGCSMLCAGNSSEYCGGPDRIDMYQLNSSAPIPTATVAPPVSTPTGGPITVQSAGSYIFYGCYADNTNGRALAALQNPESGAGNTVEACATACAGYKYMGVEYGAECYCANTITGGNGPATGGTNPTQNGCSMTCAGNASEYCGGPNRLNIYTLNLNATTTGNSTVTGTSVSTSASTTPTPTGPQTVGNFSNWLYMGCYSEATNNRALSDLQNPISGLAVTVEACAVACAGYGYFGTEYSSECYCGNTINIGSALVAGSTPAQTLCDMTCSGNASEYCGGPSRLNMYQSKGTAASTATATATAIATVSSTTVTAATPTGPITVTNLTGHVYMGCYSEATSGRALSGLLNPVSGNQVTVEACSVACAGYIYFGVEYSSECYCGNVINTGSALVVGTTPLTTQCKMACSGNPMEYCGGPNRLNMYLTNGTSTSTSTTATGSSSATTFSTGINSTAAISSTTAASSSTATPTPTGPITVGNFTGWSYMGCYSEATNNRALSDLQNPISGTAVTVEACAAACAGYTHVGVEYSGEAIQCYCGNVINTGSVLVAGDSPAVTQCNMVCSGNATEYCGGPNRLNMYQKATVPSSSLVAIKNTASSAASSNTSSLSVATSSSIGPASQNKVILVMPGSSTVFNTSSTTLAATTMSVVSSTSMTASGSLLPSTGTTSSSGTTSSTSLAPSTSLASSTGASSANTTASTSAPISSTGAVFTTLSSASSSSPSVSILSSSAVNSTSTSSTSTTSTTSATTYLPTPGQITNHWAYLGCANETSPRALVGASYSDGTNMTIESCQAFCSSSTNNYGLAGLEYASECYCGNGLQSGSTLGHTNCNMPCDGNSSEICGGSSALSMYNLTTYVPPTTVKAVGPYVSKGCYKESTTGRLLSGASYTNATGMTVESCIAFCQSANQAYAGLEYAKECFCATSLPTTATTAPIASCNMLCTGNNKEFCGAGGLLNVYYNDPSSVNSAGVPNSVNQPNVASVAANTTAPATGTASPSPAARKIRRLRSEELA